jgi:hypothetical protein
MAREVLYDSVNITVTYKCIYLRDTTISINKIDRLSHSKNAHYREDRELPIEPDKWNKIENKIIVFWSGVLPIYVIYIIWRYWFTIWYGSWIDIVVGLSMFAFFYYIFVGSSFLIAKLFCTKSYEAYVPAQYFIYTSINGTDLCVYSEYNYDEFLEIYSAIETAMNN